MSISPDDALLSAEQLALVLSWSHKSVKRSCASQRWYADELPAPLDDVTPLGSDGEAAHAARVLTELDNGSICIHSRR